MRRRLFHRASVTAVTLALLTIAMTACGSSDTSDKSAGNPSDTSSEATGSPAAPEKLTIAIPAVNSAFALPFLAESLGYFDKAGVDVTFQNGVGANALTYVSVGKADLTMFGAANSFPPVQQGRPTTIIYNQSGGGIAGDVAVKADSPYHSIDDLAGQRVAVLGTSGSGYGLTQVYSHEVEKAKGHPFHVVSFSDASTLAASLSAGSVAAVVGNAGQFISGVNDGKFRLLVDMADQATREKLVGPYFAETAIFGLTSDLAEKKEAVIDFLRGIDAADAWMHSHQPAEIAQELAKSKAYQTTSLDVLTADVESSYPFLTPDHGKIDSSLWDRSLAQYKLWNIPGVDLSSNDFTFDKRVDMSYLDAATASPLQ